MASTPPSRPSASTTYFQAPRSGSSARGPLFRPRRRVSWALRMIYCIALLAPIVPAAVFGGLAWVEMNTSASAWPAERIAAVLIVLGRFVFVMIRPRALQAYVAVPL